MRDKVRVSDAQLLNSDLNADLLFCWPTRLQKFQPILRAGVVGCQRAEVEHLLSVVPLQERRGLKDTHR